MGACRPLWQQPARALVGLRPLGRCNDMRRKVRSRLYQSAMACTVAGLRTTTSVACSACAAPREEQGCLSTSAKRGRSLNAASHAEALACRRHRHPPTARPPVALPHLIKRHPLALFCAGPTRL